MKTLLKIVAITSCTLSLLAALLATSYSCQAEASDISDVQSNAFAKELFIVANAKVSQLSAELTKMTESHAPLSERRRVLCRIERLQHSLAEESAEKATQRALLKLLTNAESDKPEKIRLTL